MSTGPVTFTTQAAITDALASADDEFESLEKLADNSDTSENTSES